MIDRAARDQLADAIDRHLRHEIDYGQLWGEAFAMLGESEEDAVNFIADELNPTMPRKDVAFLRRCRAFLMTQQDYRWPRIVIRSPEYYRTASLWLTAGVVVGSLAILLSSSPWPRIVILFATIAAIVVIWFTHSFLNRREIQAQIRRHRREGREFEAWPFTTISDSASRDESVDHDATKPKSVR